MGLSPVFLFIYYFIPLASSVRFQITRFGPDVHQVLLEGDAKNSGGEIQINKDDLFRVGRLLYNERVPIWDEASGKLTDFSTHFSFKIDTQNRSIYGSGLAFFLAPVGFGIPPNSGNGYLGLFNTTQTDDIPQSQIVSIEFDSFANKWDPRYEHVGINVNSISSVVTFPWNVSLHSGESADAWIMYNSATHNLTVLWSYGSGANSTLSYEVDLQQVLPPWVVIGFSAATGLYKEQHILESWEFSSALVVKEGGTSRGEKIGFSLLGCSLITGAAVVVIVLRKRKKKKGGEDQKISETTILETTINEDDDLERGTGPRRFLYEELAIATHNFSDNKRLGEGGFGGVYKGYLINLDMPVAVKKFSRGSKQGKKEYITEVKIISLLRHRNLVQLIGWCHDQNEFLLVYEFMLNGSLDFHLFGKRNPLIWSFRYKIALGLASALLYLHEEWEQCVIHRDIKSSNIMLDSNFNVKLGDFGLARLIDHELGPQTTGPAGTLGYLAPEYVSTGRASKESDMYSFGVVMLEIATGRKVVDRSERKLEEGLVEWVWELYGKGKLLLAIDEKIGREFDAREVECVIIVGLWCAHPDHTLRPSIRVANRVLNFEAELPMLPMHMPVAMYCAPSNPSMSSGEPLITNSSNNEGT